jgi:hypothetical protein
VALSGTSEVDLQQHPLCASICVLAVVFSIKPIVLSSIVNCLLLSTDVRRGPTLQTTRKSGFRSTLRIAHAASQATFQTDRVSISKVEGWSVRKPAPWRAPNLWPPRHPEWLSTKAARRARDHSHTA